MSGFFKQPKQGASTGSTLTPNVGQYGWTLYESQSVSQIIGFVNEAKGYAVEAAASANSARESSELALVYVNEAKAWAGKAEVFYGNSKDEADRSERYANQSVDIYNAFLNVAANQRIIETFDLTAEQTVVNFTKIFADASYISVNGQRVDSSSLVKDLDYTITGISQITLKRRYPLGTKLSAVQDIKKDDSIPGVSESSSIWNRQFINALVGVNFGTYIVDGRTLTPRLVFEGAQYIPTFDATESVTITDIPIKHNNGDITVGTSKGNRLFSKTNAEAMSRKDVYDVVTVFSTSDASDMVVQVEGTKTARKLKDRFEAVHSFSDYGPNGNGGADNEAAFKAADASGRNVLVEGTGVYFTTYTPTSKYYTNHSASIKLGDTVYRLSTVPQEIATLQQSEPDGNVVRLSNFAIGQDAGKTFTNSDTQYANTAIGTSAAQNLVEGRRITAIGPYALKDVNKGFSLTAIGTTAGEWMNWGDRNLLVGDNSGKNLGNGTPEERHILYVASNPDPMGWNAIWPEWRNFTGPVDAPLFKMTAADYEKKATHNVGVGRNALGFSITTKDSVAVGYDAVTFNLGGNGIVGVGDRVMQWNIKGSHITAVGSKAMQSTLDSLQDTAIGCFAMQKYTHSSQNIALGYQALWGNAAANVDTPQGNVAIGRISMANATGNVSYNVSVGASSLTAVGSNDNTAVGAGSLGRIAGAGGGNTAIGRNALILMQNASNATSLTNCTGIGQNSRVSGDNQVQLGDANTTTYVYGTVQNRSDARDKIDVEDTVLGIDFINGLRPVDGRWNLREDYQQLMIDEATGLATCKQLPNDGSKARSRKHHWFIAQEVQELCHAMGVEFGGFQDHKVRGGDDVMSLGYDEFIPPITKAIQDCWSEIQSIKSRLDKLEV